MKKPVARPTGSGNARKTGERDTARGPRAFAPTAEEQMVESYTEDTAPDDAALTAPPGRRHPLWRLLFATVGILVSLALGLAAESLIRGLFARYEWLGWLGLGVIAILVVVAVLLAINEVLAILRLRKLSGLRERAGAVIESDSSGDGRKVVGELAALYAGRADMARPRTELDADLTDMIDGADMVRTTERNLMGPLDTRARSLTAAAARRVAIVTAISPRALVDIAFVAYESFKLARAVADLYGARPGFFGSWRLAGAILGHLAVTGGVALGDSVVQQLVGHGLAAKLSAKLGEGLVNGLMTVRVGIAAMRVTRPMPFETLRQPVVMDFMSDLARITDTEQAKER